MKSGNREINIFNMSLLDILCGALGAFCFMMLALFPYYKPSLKEAIAPNAATIDPKTLEQALDEVRAARAQIQHLQSMVANLRGNNGGLQSQMGTMKQQMAQLAKENEKENGQLDMRLPIVVNTFWQGHAQARVDTWVVDVHPTASKLKIAFDPSQPTRVFWAGDAAFSYIGTPGSTSTLIRDRPANYDYDVYANIYKFVGQPGNVLVYMVLMDSKYDKGSRVTEVGWFLLTPEKRYIKVGTIHVDKDRNATFEESNELKQQEQAAAQVNLETAEPASGPTPKAITSGGTQ